MHYKYAVGETRQVGPYKVRIVGLTKYHSDALNMDLPKYIVQTYLGNSGQLDSQQWEAYEHEVK